MEWNKNLKHILTFKFLHYNLTQINNQPNVKCGSGTILVYVIIKSLQDY